MPLTPLVAKAEIILNWFVLIKFTLTIIAIKYLVLSLEKSAQEGHLGLNTCGAKDYG